MNHICVHDSTVHNLLKERVDQLLTVSVCVCVCVCVCMRARVCVCVCVCR